jgi:hypothetical protein
MNPIDRPWLVFLLCMAAFSLAARSGAGLLQSRASASPESREDFGVVLAATLTLLRLIIGFTFSMAISRYDQRKNYEEAEANAIGTEYLRADLLPDIVGLTTRISTAPAAALFGWCPKTSRVCRNHCTDARLCPRSAGCCTLRRQRALAGMHRGLNLFGIAVLAQARYMPPNTAICAFTCMAARTKLYLFCCRDVCRIQ